MSGLPPREISLPSAVGPAALPVETRLYIALLEWRLFCAEAEIKVWRNRARAVLAGATPVSPKWRQYRSTDTGSARLRHLALLMDAADQSPTERWGRELRATMEWEQHRP